MTLFGKPLGGPDPVGGLFPRRESYVFQNGGTNDALLLGEPCMLDLTAISTLITDSDSNAFYPSANDDTVWNTVVATAGRATNASQLGGIFGIAKEAVATNANGEIHLFGIVNALCNGPTAATDGMPLYLSPTTNALYHTTTNAAVSNLRQVAFYLDPRTNTSRSLRRVFFHNGIFGGANTALT